MSETARDGRSPGLPAPGGFGGLIAKLSQAVSRRLYGNRTDLAPVDAWAHHPLLLAGYGGFESSVAFSRRVDPRLKQLAELKAAAVVGCEWCLDFGSWLVQRDGLGERELRELPRHRESDAFTPVEKLVLDYAAGISRSPADVPEELLSSMREHFDAGQLVELAAAIVVENLRSRFNLAVGLEPQGFCAGGLCAVPERAVAPADSMLSGAQ